MRLLFILFLSLGFNQGSLPLLSQVTTQDFSFLSPEENTFVRSELARLTLEQKAGQMTQVAVDLVFEGPTYRLTVPPMLSEERIDNILGELQIGSIINHPSRTYPTPAEFREYIGVLQAKAMATTGVPLLYGLNAIHGANYVSGATLFAQPLGIAATFNTELAEALAGITAYELKAASIPLNFSPAVDIGRNPAWPRTYESFGEDPYVNQRFGLATVRGYQGGDAGKKTSVAACLKHFTGYSIPRSGHDRTPTYLSERQLREYFLPPYRAAIDAGVLTLMINPGEINGIPVHADKRLLTQILRDEMGFEGLLFSNWGDVRALTERHKVARNLKEAVRISIEAGMDVSMTAVKTAFPRLVVELVREGRLSEARIDTSVARILAVKVALGLYEQHLWDPAEFPDFGSEAHLAKARQSAEESVILLKNDGLPLPIKEGQRIFVTGPTADNMRSLNGGWTYSWQGQDADRYLDEYQTIREALEAEFGDRVSYAPGVAYDTLIDVEEALRAADAADILVVCVGELSYTEYPGNIDNLNLPSVQRKYVAELSALGKPIVLIMAGGRPRIITDMAQRARAILFAPYPGPYGGNAIAGILSGRINPSARLPLTYPRSPNSIVFYDHKYSEAINGKYKPLFSFGHGLSFTEFKYSDLRLSSRVLRPDEILEVSVRVTNRGERAGKHAVLLYTSDLYATITPAVKRLRKFTKLELDAGESKVVKFQLMPEDLSFVGLDLKPTTEPGEFRLTIGDQSKEFSYER